MLLSGKFLTEAHIVGLDCVISKQGSRSGTRGLAADARRLYRKAESLLKIDRSAKSLQALALLEVYGKNFAAASALLEEAIEKNPQDLSIANDLAAVLIESGNLKNGPYDYVRSIESSDRACKHGITDSCFNKYLALKKLHLIGEERLAWRKYRSLATRREVEEEQAKGWGYHRVRVTTDEEWKQVFASLERADDVQIVGSIVARFPAQVRMYLEELGLPEWGKLFFEDKKRAASLLGRLQLYATSLCATGGDCLARDSVSAVLYAAQSGASLNLMALAEGHRRYGVAVALFKERKLIGARAEMAKSRELFRQGRSPFMLWSTFYIASCDYYQFMYAEATREASHNYKNFYSYNAVDARMEWLQGLIALSRGNPAEAKGRYSKALSLFMKIGERESQYALSSLLAEASLYLGEVDLSWKFRETALSGLAYLSISNRSQLILSEAAAACLKLKQVRGALEFQNEAVRIAEARGDNHSIADAHLRRIPISYGVDDPEMALNDLKTVAEHAARVPDFMLRDRLLADAWLEHGRGILRTYPRSAIDSFDVALGYYQSIGYRFPLIEIYQAKASCYKSLGLYGAAISDLQHGLGQVDRLNDEIVDEKQREAFLLQVESILDEVIDLAVRNNQFMLALQYAEWKSNLAIPSNLLDLKQPLTDWLLSLPPNVTVIRYYVLTDRVLIWKICGSRVQLFEQAISRANLRNAVDTMRRATIGTQVDSGSFEKSATFLFDLLIRAAGLRDNSGPLVVIPDKELGSVPFAALLNHQEKKFLVEGHAVSVNISLASFVHLKKIAKSSSRQSLLAFGNPEINTDIFPSILPLPGAEGEVKALQPLYPRAFVAFGRDATKETFLGQAGSYEVLHLGVHGISVNGFSSLILAPTDRSSSGSLSGLEVLPIKFERTQVAVLAACGNLDDSLANIAPYFLASGVPGVIASLWDIKDDSVSKGFFLRVHEGIREGLDAASALRIAQVSLISKDRQIGQLRPQRWAAFSAYGAVSAN